MARYKNLYDLSILADFYLCKKDDVSICNVFFKFFFCGYDRSNSISCTLSFLTSGDNNENGTIINKTFDRFDSGKAFGHVSS